MGAEEQVTGSAPDNGNSDNDESIVTSTGQEEKSEWSGITTAGGKSQTHDDDEQVSA